MTDKITSEIFERLITESVVPCVTDTGIEMIISSMSGGADYTDGDFERGFPRELYLRIKNAKGEIRTAKYVFHSEASEPQVWCGATE